MEQYLPSFPVSEEDELMIACAKEMLANIENELSRAGTNKDKLIWIQHKAVVERVLRSYSA